MKGLNKVTKWLGAASILACSMPAMADNATLVMPKCLYNALNIQHKVLSQNDAFALVSMQRDKIENLRLLAHKKHCGGFIDVSHKLKRQGLKINHKTFLNHFTKPKKSYETESYRVSHQDKVKSLLMNVEPTIIWHTLESLTQFEDRSASTDNGVKAAHWLKDNFDKMAKEAGRNDTHSYLVDSGWYKQPSVVTVIGKDIKSDAVVLGAHMDTLSYSKPGADDDGSGSSSLVEAARVLLNSKEKLAHPVYIIWYAAEERGLVGSQHVVADFVEKNIPVKAVLQFDMTGYRYHKKSKIWMIGDNVNTELSKFVESLVKTYTGVDVGWTECHYACSDHASWTQEGFKSAFPFEARFGEEDPYIHTGEDKMEYVSLEHMTNFAKIGIAFAVELAS